jgi:hypothetical protein
MRAFYSGANNFEQNANYRHHEMDFGRRLIAKFRFNPATFWSSVNWPQATEDALYPKNHRDPLLGVALEVKGTLSPVD